MRATIGRVEVTLVPVETIVPKMHTPARCVAEVRNDNGKTLGILVRKTGPDTGEYVDIVRDVEWKHVTDKSDWYVALGHKPVMRKSGFTPLASDKEVSGLKFPPAPVILDDGKTPGWDAVGSRVYVYTNIGGRRDAMPGTITGLDYTCTSKGVPVVKLDNGRCGGTITFDPIHPSQTTVYQMLPPAHPLIVQAITPEKEFGRGWDCGFESDLDSWSGGRYG